MTLVSLARGVPRERPQRGYSFRGSPPAPKDLRASVPLDPRDGVAELSLEVSLVHHELKLLRRRVGLLERGSVQGVAEVGESVLRRGADGGQRLERGARHVDLRVVAHDEDQRGHGVLAKLAQLARSGAACPRRLALRVAHEVVDVRPLDLLAYLDLRLGAGRELLL